MYKIRYADANDAKVLGEIHSKSWEVAYKDIVPDEILNRMTAEKRQKYFHKALTEYWEEDALIFKDNKAAGFICIGKCRDKDKDDTYGEIWGLYLLPEYWNKGIGTYFINWGLNELKRRNYKKATLWVLEENLNARKFYEKIGFEHDGTVEEITIGKKLKEYRYIKDIV
jgi:ribosomal protein S18 acetylase RimI-like enzyme